MGCGKQGMVWRRFAAPVVQPAPRSLQRATPHPALRATFPSKLGKESPSALV